MNGTPESLRKLIFQRLIEAGRPTRFGPDWAGCRCSAKTRSGTLCQKPAIRGSQRCQLHGGLSTGPRTEEGRQRTAAANTKHGQRTKDRIKEQRGRTEANKRINHSLRRQIELMKEQGYLPKNWKA